MGLPAELVRWFLNSSVSVTQLQKQRRCRRRHHQVPTGLSCAERRATDPAVLTSVGLFLSCGLRSEENHAMLKKFVADQGAAMDYNVAQDVDGEAHQKIFAASGARGSTSPHQPAAP